MNGKLLSLLVFYESLCIIIFLRDLWHLHGISTAISCSVQNRLLYICMCTEKKGFGEIRKTTKAFQACSGFLIILIVAAIGLGMKTALVELSQRCWLMTPHFLDNLTIDNTSSIIRLIFQWGGESAIVQEQTCCSPPWPGWKIVTNNNLKDKKTTNQAENLFFWQKIILIRTMLIKKVTITK